MLLYYGIISIVSFGQNIMEIDRGLFGDNIPGLSRGMKEATKTLIRVA
jgi:hypothetical protein